MKSFEQFAAPDSAKTTRRADSFTFKQLHILTAPLCCGHNNREAQDSVFTKSQNLQDFTSSHFALDYYASLVLISPPGISSDEFLRNSE
jgi:hypothetical protein